MRPDIVNLRQFYSSRLGRKAKARLRQIALDHWPDHQGESILGIGYAPPVLRAFERAGALVAALMPASQGAIYWPVHAENHSILGDEMRPPFAPNSIPRILLMHAFEHVPDAEELLRVTWQMLTPGGRLLLIVPNRRGLWARFGNTPFATGTPYTLTVIKSLLHDADFTLRDVSAAFFVPPSGHPFWLRSWGILEWLGRICFARSGGVFVIEAEKQIYAAIGEIARKPVAAQNWQAQQGAPA